MSAMQCTGRPHGGEGRGPSDEDGLWARENFEGGSQLASHVELIEELLQVRQGSACIEASDVLAVASLLTGIADEPSDEVRKSVEGGSATVILGGEPRRFGSPLSSPAFSAADTVVGPLEVFSEALTSTASGVLVGTVGRCWRSVSSGLSLYEIGIDE